MKKKRRKKRRRRGDSVPTLFFPPLFGKRGAACLLSPMCVFVPSRRLIRGERNGQKTRHHHRRAPFFSLLYPPPPRRRVPFMCGKMRFCSLTKVSELSCSRDLLSPRKKRRFFFLP